MILAPKLGRLSVDVVTGDQWWIGDRNSVRVWWRIDDFEHEWIATIRWRPWVVRDDSRVRTQAPRGVFVKWSRFLFVRRPLPWMDTRQAVAR